MLSVRAQLISLTVFLISIVTFSTVAHGHALQPGYLELRLIDTELYSVL